MEITIHEKYGLKTDIESVKRRIEYRRHREVASNIVWGEMVKTEDAKVRVKALAIELRHADLTLLCDLAEKGELLAERDKPMKMTTELHTDYDSHGQWRSLHCGSCSGLIVNSTYMMPSIENRDKFCPNCGHRIAWDDTEVKGE